MTAMDGWLLGVAAALVVLASVLASAEAALARVSRSRAAELAERDGRPAQRLQTVLGEPVRYLNVLLLLRVAAELTATVLVAVVAADGLGGNWQAILLAAGVMTVVDYVLVGVAARTIGRQRPERLAMRAARLALLLSRVLGPLPRVLILLGNAFTPGKGFREGPFTTEAELRELVDLAEAGQVIERDEREMIHSVFELGDTIVREVMVPRTDVVWIERTKSVRQALSLALRSGFSRLPVTGENEDDVVGVAYLKDLARRVLQEQDRGGQVDSVMRPAYYVPDSKPADELLREMQAHQVHLAVVIDEYGGTAGLVTIEDILEEIVGEIADEYDREGPRVERLDDHTVRVNVRLPVDELEEMFGVHFDVEDVDTVGGLLAAAVGRVPIPGTQVTVQGLKLTAEAGSDRRHRIGTVLVERTGGSGATAESAAAAGAGPATPATSEPGELPVEAAGG
jgi:CBS domain containing-hemolysin-like protein